MGWESPRPRGVQRFNQYDQLIQATVGGQGIAISRLELIQPLLADRRLAVLAAPRRLGATEYCYWLLQADAEPRDDVRQVGEWILEEARATAAEV